MPLSFLLVKANKRKKCSLRESVPVWGLGISYRRWTPGSKMRRDISFFLSQLFYPLNYPERSLSACRLLAKWLSCWSRACSSEPVNPAWGQDKAALPPRASCTSCSPVVLPVTGADLAVPGPVQTHSKKSWPPKRLQLRSETWKSSGMHRGRKGWFCSPCAFTQARSRPGWLTYLNVSRNENQP